MNFFGKTPCGENVCIECLLQVVLKSQEKSELGWRLHQSSGGTPQDVLFSDEPRQSFNMAAPGPHWDVLWPEPQGCTSSIGQ